MNEGVGVCYIDQDIGKNYAKSDVEAGVGGNWRCVAGKFEIWKMMLGKVPSTPPYGK
jgi:hypothetical protein